MGAEGNKRYTAKDGAVWVPDHDKKKWYRISEETALPREVREEVQADLKNAEEAHEALGWVD